MDTEMANVDGTISGMGGRAREAETRLIPRIIFASCVTWVLIGSSSRSEAVLFECLTNTGSLVITDSPTQLQACKPIDLKVFGFGSASVPSVESGPQVSPGVMTPWVEPTGGRAFLGGAPSGLSPSHDPTSQTLSYTPTSDTVAQDLAEGAPSSPPTLVCPPSLNPINALNRLDCVPHRAPNHPGLEKPPNLTGPSNQ